MTITKTKDKDIEKQLGFRAMIGHFAEQLSTVEGITYGDNADCPLKHTFCEGIYVRQIAMPAGTVCVGKIHRHEHPNFLMKGRVTVVTEEGGIEELKGPLVMMSPAGTQRAVYVHEDALWVTIHHNPDNEKDLDKLEDFIIAKSYDDIPDIIRRELPCHGSL